MLLSLDGTLVVQLVNFIIFLVILNAIFLKPVGSAIAARREYIDSVGEDITAAEAELKSLRVQADDARSAARRAADATIGESRATAQAESASIIAEHQIQAADMIAEAQSAVHLEMAQARSTSGPVVEKLAREMLERAVGPEAVTR
jgi:F-type H+-transporting ATPase subunit b